MTTKDYAHCIQTNSTCLTVQYSKISCMVIMTLGNS